MSTRADHILSLRAGAQTALLSRRGAALLRYTVAGEPVVAAPAGDAAAAEYAGATLAPWPNRLRDGRWSWNGTDHAVPVTEEETRTALHGLTAHRGWDLVCHSAEAATFATLLGDCPGYPFAVSLEVRYRLTTAGLEVWVHARNEGDRAAPIGLGSHPYLAVRGQVDDVTLTVPARHWLEFDERGLPRRRHLAAGSAMDFREPSRVGDRRLDTAFTALARDRQGRAVVRIQDHGRTVELWGDAACRWFMVFTADTLPSPRRRRVLAVEPMTCPPDALRSGEDLIVLQPGEEHRLGWGLRAYDQKAAA